jgi:hypothetical protein
MNAHPRTGTLSETEIADARADIAAQLRDTVSTSFTLIDLRRLHSAGNLLAIATLELNLGGIEVLLHGVQVVRTPAGKLQCKAPHHRLPTGQWVPSIVLPYELEIAIGRETLAAFTDDA